MQNAKMPALHLCIPHPPSYAIQAAEEVQMTSVKQNPVPKAKAPAANSQTDRTSGITYTPEGWSVRSIVESRSEKKPNALDQRFVDGCQDIEEHLARHVTATRQQPGQNTFDGLLVPFHAKPKQHENNAFLW